MDDLVASTLSSSLKIPHAVARFLVSRGIRTVSDAYHMLRSSENDVHDPFLMMGMDKAVEWILAVRERGERVFIFGDYDLDGMTSVTLLTRCLKTVGVESEWRLPNRFGDGYGLSVSAVDEMYEAGARNLITVDTGITANAEIAHAKELGMAVMVMDHHQPSGDGLPVSDVLLDPHQDGDNYPNPELCGVGVSYKFICALYSRLGLPNPVEYLDLVALGTLADLVQMTPENRFFTRSGLECLKNSRWPENKSEAPQLLAELKEWNVRRKEKEAEITEMAMEQVKTLYGDTIPTVIVVAGENWHVGVIGIVAAKLAQEFHRPSAVLSIIDGMAHASARAVPGFNWHKALFESRELFDRWGGHANAAGFSLESSRIDELRGRLLQSAAEQGYTGDVVNTDESYPYDIKIALSELVVESRAPSGRYPVRERSILDYIDLLEPFGGNFPYPTFRAEGVTVHRVRELRGGHLQMEISQAGSNVFPAIAFGLRKSRALLGRSRPVTVVFEPIWNYFNNTKTVQLCIKSIE